MTDGPQKGVVGHEHGPAVLFGGCMFDGGLGGEGGRGGHGGGGGGGAGGISFDIYIGNSNGATRNYASQNTFELGGTATGGTGGTGGNSSNTATGLGMDGATGDSGSVQFVP
ncbi:MAG: hypothetical protein AAFX99_34425 [Myxococcota bacterium]